jgi:hypothetical protein
MTGGESRCSELEECRERRSAIARGVVQVEEECDSSSSCPGRESVQQLARGVQLLEDSREGRTAIA